MKSLEIINKMTLKEAKEIELQRQESQLVELAIPDKLISTLKNAKQLNAKFDQLNSLYVKFRTEAPTLLKSIQTDLSIIEQEEARVSKLVKELGMNPSELPYLKEAGVSFSLLSKLENILKTNLK
jgi:hypothetical protein